jgi:hypothetical protein
VNRIFVFALFAPLLAGATQVVFLEPVGKIDTNRAEVEGAPKRFQRVDGSKFQPWLENDWARRALRLYEQAFAVLEAAGNPQKQPREYFVALVPGGNHASVGFAIEGENVDHSKHAYILLDAEKSRFESTMLHETGHVAMAMLAGGKQLPRADVAAIPHSTAALSDRATAFSEGWAIHLETLGAQLATTPDARRVYHREGIVFGAAPYRASEYFRQASDLASYAQNYTRFAEVRENAYAFEPAFKGSDYLRTQLEKARDYAAIRDANQLLQSEGFYASFFYLFLMRGEKQPSEDVIASRHNQMLRAMSGMFRETKMEEDTPWLIHWVRAYIKLFPEEKGAVVDALNDLSHGAFVDANAAAMWRQHYLAALRLDLKNLAVQEITKTRASWREKVLADPDVLLSRVGPQLRCEVPSVQVKIEAFGEASPLLFDANTAPEGVLRLVPELGDEARGGWIAKRPFQSMNDLHTRVPESKKWCKTP